MNLTASEQATVNFYNWEYRHRGYYRFDTPVDIEVPYLPFRHAIHSSTSIIDDGRAPSLFKSISKLLAPTKPKEELPQEVVEVNPRFLSFEPEPVFFGLVISFPKGTEILPTRNNEFLNMFSFTESLISFEIIGTSDDITIQIVCRKYDKERVQSHLLAYFPNIIVNVSEVDGFGFSTKSDIAIADFGLNDEFMRPIATTDSFSIDPLTSVIATMESLQGDDIVVFQMLFKGITSPLSKDITYSVSDGAGGSFFSDAPEMPVCAKDKIANPLFSVVMRIATQGNTDIRSQYLAQELARSITTVSSSLFNKLIPLSNEGYKYDYHHHNLHNRLSNRLGFILNSKELNTFIHYPNKSVISKKLGLGTHKTKRQKTTEQSGIYLGENIHQGESFPIYLNTENRLSHIHILGATGVGKSTLIAGMILEDIRQGVGCAIFDPHGDLCESVLKRVPENRKDDVIIIDPSDSDFPIGFNLLEAKTEAEKIVLSSDLVTAFKRHATAWGDNIQSVLSNAISTILESSRGGTLIELKRFLIEEKFRNEYLTSVDDPSLHYYWENEYPMARKGIAPLLTRIDTFLRPKLVRYMLAQRQGVDISECLENNKIVLLKLSQGLIGEQNSYLLGSLFLAKFNQSALARQIQRKEERKPYMLYLDEFQNFITPSIERILSGARKYALGITLVHQELGQIQDTSLLNSVLSNPKTRICFRLGDNDAKRLESGFSFFEQLDLQSLERGEAIMRIGSSNNDFNINTKALEKVTRDYSQDIISSVRNNYGTPRKEVEELLVSLLPKQTHFKKKAEKEVKKVDSTKDIIEIVEVPSSKPAPIITAQKQVVLDELILTDDDLERRKSKYLKQAEEQEVVRKHRSLQYYVRSMALQRGFKVILEKATQDGGRVDVALVNDDIRIAIEISVTNRVNYEIKNIQKCIDDDYSLVYMISDDEKHLTKIKEQALNSIARKHHTKIHFFASEDLLIYLDALKQPKATEKRVRGYRVKVNYKTDNDTSKQSLITKIIMNALRKK